jgi:putative DNA primase/helicase
MNDVIHLFLEEMRRRGLDPVKDIVADGELHRFAPAGSRPDDIHSWYILHLDAPISGAFGSWKSGQKFTWTQNAGREPSAEERELLKKRIEADRKKRQRKEEEDRKKARELAGYIWDSAPEAIADHPYLKRKKIKAHGARFSERGHYIGCLIIPVLQKGDLVGLQFIPPDSEREKRFLHGTPIQGSYAVIGPKPEKKLIICEGFATGGSIHEATGVTVVCAFNAGNLEAVAKIMRETFPEVEIFIAIDDDRWTTTPVPNPGLHYGSKAAAAIGAEIRRPSFAPGFKGKPTDFNDLADIHGMDEVTYQIATGNPTFVEDMPVTVERVSPGIRALRDPFPHMTSTYGGKPLGTIENLQALLDRVGAIVRYNVISKNEEIIIPGSSYTIDNQDNAAFAQVLSWCAYAKMPTDKVGNFLTTLADRNQFNPVGTWIQSKPWDGKSRLHELYKTIVAKNEDTDPGVGRLKEILIRKWLISAVAAAFRPNGVSAHGVLVFQGEQYLGKTAWFKRLAPAELDVIKDGMILRLDDKDSIKQVISNWMVELGELDATFKRSDISQMKAFITKDRDVLRQAYARKESSFARRTVFFASVNPEDFLHDPTGNRRYWTIACEKIIYDHDVDIQQVWAEVLELFKKGETWFLSREEMQMLNESNKEHEFKDPLEEKIRSTFDWSSRESLWAWKTASEILDLMGQTRPSAGDLSKTGLYIRRLNGGKVKRTAEARKLLVPRKKDMASLFDYGKNEPEPEKETYDPDKF